VSYARACSRRTEPICRALRRQSSLARLSCHCAARPEPQRRPVPSSSPRASHSWCIVASISEKSPDGVLPLLPIDAPDFFKSARWGSAITAVRVLSAVLAVSRQGVFRICALRVQASSPSSSPRFVGPIEWPKRIRERAAGGAQAGLKRKDARIRVVEPHSRRDLALARSIVGLPRRRVLDAVVGRRGDQGQPVGQAIFDIGSKFKLSIRRNRNEMPLRIERKGGIRIREGNSHAASTPAPMSPRAAAMSARVRRGIRTGKPLQPARRGDNYRHIKIRKNGVVPMTSRSDIAKIFAIAAVIAGAFYYLAHHGFERPASANEA
jgi:hypothetical protein